MAMKVAIDGQFDRIENPLVDKPVVMPGRMFLD